MTCKVCQRERRPDDLHVGDAASDAGDWAEIAGCALLGYERTQAILAALTALDPTAIKYAGDALDHIATDAKDHPHRAAFNRLAHWLWRVAGAERD